MREWLVLGGVLAFLGSVHAIATATHGFVLPESVRERVGASADTVWSRFHAHFVGPFFHDNLFHILYNSAIFALVLPIAFRAYGPKSLLLGYLASPISGIAVDVLLVLPLAKTGWAPAIEAAQAKLVGASVVAFALAGMALVSLVPRLGPWALAVAGGIVIYELVLAAFELTRPFVWAYHLTGFGLGAAMGAVVGSTQ